MGKRYDIDARQSRRSISKKAVIAIVGLLLVIGAGFGGYTLYNNNNADKQTVVSSQKQQEDKPMMVEPEEPEVPPVPLVDLQPTLDAWLAGKSVDYSVEVFDIVNQKVIAAHQPNKQYFTASIYKFYVAYLTYQRIQSGEFTNRPNVVGTQDLLACQHAMIYTSDSPCGEAVMKQLTQEVMQSDLRSYGTKDTEFPRFVTSAHDANIVLSRFALKKDLNEEWDTKLRTSMETQVYSRGLIKGFAGATVASKVGFNENINFHEVGLVTYPDGRQYAVSIFSQGQGSSSPLASLSAALNEKLKTVN